MYRRILVLTAGLLLSPSIYGQMRGLQPSDYYSESSVSQPALSPDGKLVAFTVMTIDEKENKRHREIWVQRLQDGVPQNEPFRFTDPTEDSSSPIWSPDGTLLSFNSRRGKDKNSVWFLRVDAPGGEAFHISGVEGAPNWSPDGRWIAFTKRPEEEDTEEAGSKRKGWIASNAISNTLDAARFDGRVITSMRYKRDGTLPLRPDPLIQEKRQLFVVSAEGGEATQLTDLAFDVGNIEWSPDSTVILFTGNEKQDDEYNRDQTADIFAIARQGGEARSLTTNPGSESSPAWSRQGGQLAFLHTPERGAQTDLMVVGVGPDGTFSGPPSNLTASWDMRPGSPQWTPDGTAIRFGGGVGGNSHIFEVPAQGGRVRQVTRGDRRLSGFSSDRNGTLAVYTVTDSVTPTELFLADYNGNGERPLTSFNSSWLEEVDLRPAEPLTWTVADGTQIEGWVVPPVGHDPAKRYPLILKIHGGPHGAYGNTFFRTFHVLSASGFFVLYPNPRGSTGYGHAFTYATRGKWGEMDSEDYLGGVEAAIAKYPTIDPQRVGVSGGSYGGFMTNWLTATTDRFAAAVTSRSIVNWESWYGMSDAQGLTEHEFYGTPWEQRELYRRLSPISYVENVTAPTLIIHSEQDWRTPIGDGEQWFMALRKLKVPVEMVRYPRSSHGLSRSGEPWLLVDRLERLRSWFVHWLIENPAGAPPTEPGR